MSEVIESDPEAPAALAHLAEEGITPIVLVASKAGMNASLAASIADFRTVASTDGADADDDDGSARLIAAARAGIELGGTHLLVSQISVARRAAESGCRPIIVIGERTLDEALGPGEPEAKHAGAAPDMETAVRYVSEELAQLDALGPFPHGPHHIVAEAAGTLPSGADLFKFYGLVILAGTAVALGIAYFLRELYEEMTLPSIAWYVTLQFLPEWVRGLLFIAVGIGIGVAASRVISADRRRFG